MKRRLRAGPIACDAHGICAELLPELITLDDWGYPIISGGAVPHRLRPHVRRSVAGCPTLALLVERAPELAEHRGLRYRASSVRR